MSTGKTITLSLTIIAIVALVLGAPIAAAIGESVKANGLCICNCVIMQVKPEIWSDGKKGDFGG